MARWIALFVDGNPAAAGFSGEPVVGGGGVLGVFERLGGRRALQGVQAKELGEGDDDGGLAADG